MELLLSLVLVLELIGYVSSFEFGWSPTYYTWDQKVDLIVNKVESDKTQLPYSYRELPFVCPASMPLGLSLGEIIQGDRLWKSNYDLRFGVDNPCSTLCHFKATKKNIEKADKLIKEGYVVDWRVDGLPGATTFDSNNHHSKYYAAGFPLGFVEGDRSYLNNHVLIVIRYNIVQENPRLYTIVGFEVYPKSVKEEGCPGASKKYEHFGLDIEKAKNSKVKDDSKKAHTLIYYTYSVYWREDRSVDHSSRWDLYYEYDSNSNQNIHWFAIINSLVLLSLFTLIVSALVMRVLKTGINKQFQSLPSSAFDENPISMVRSEKVSSKPRWCLLLTILVSSGIQLIFVAIWGIAAFYLNSTIGVSTSTSSTSVHTFFNNHQGSVFTLALLFLVVSGFIPSYCGIILHKFFNRVFLNQEYTKNKTVLLSTVFSGVLPILLLSAVLTINFILWAESASTALPFGTIIVLLILILIQISIGILGGYYGNKRKFDRKSFLLGNLDDSEQKGSLSEPFHPKSRIWLMNPFTTIAVFGLFPFGIAYVELMFIFNSVWLEKTVFYYMYGFLLLTAIFLVIIVAESAVIASYIALFVYKEPHWQWLCFHVGSSIGWYIFGYSICYFWFYLDIKDFVSVILYFAYMSIVCGLIIVGWGSVGVIAGLLFVRKVYGQAKLD